MAIRVLVVLDGVYRFVTGVEPRPDFTYTVLTGALEAAGMAVTKAHRGADGDGDINEFRFDETDLRQFDAIWLIGDLGRNSLNSSGTSGLGLGDPAEAAQLGAIARFMEAGGGVFATGDHDSIGSEMSGFIPRVRSMRAWYGINDSAMPNEMEAEFPRNYPVITAGRADTTQRNEAGDYGGDTSFVWFENQSDAIPQTVVPAPPTHPILRHAGDDITIFPDHMHEGKVLGALMMGYAYDQSIPIDGGAFVEYPEIAGTRELPKVIASGQSVPYASKSAVGGGFIGDNSAASGPKAVDMLSVYDGRAAGVGRVVTGSTFHHYVDINLTGDSGIETNQHKLRVPHGEKGAGFATPGFETTFATIKQIYVNITEWLARPRPRMELILERSTFSQPEAMAEPVFTGAFLVTVDGLKPDQFPTTDGIDSLDPGQFNPDWAPVITPQEPAGLTITPVGVSSDDPSLPPRLQRFTFRYDIEIENAAFGFADPVNTVRLDAALVSDADLDPLTDTAWMQLVKAANPFMLDLANDNQTYWLSSDLRVFPVVADGSPLAVGADRAAALAHLQTLVNGMTDAAFEALPIGQGESTLSAWPTADDGNNVYNFAVARVRLNHAAVAADGVRVFFRIVPSPTTALLTYHESGGVPAGSYLQTGGAEPIALPGEDAGGSEWLSFPVFARSRMSPPSSQEDDFNVKPIGPGDGISEYYGALIDNNLTDAYLTETPMGGPMRTLPELMAGEHQCIVAQIVYSPAPIPDGARPGTSDKLAQRNLALSTIANPGVDASRTAFHTFEIEAAPQPIADDYPPDELLLDWGGAVPPEGTEVRLYIPSWDAAEVVALADRFYPRHAIRAIDADTVALPGGGTRYVPIPRTSIRQTGVISADFPLGVKRGQRFDLSVRQISNRGRTANIPPPKATALSPAEAAALLPAGVTALAGAAVPRGAFDLGGNRTLITDLKLLDASGDHAVLIEHPDPALVAAARRDSGSWRETVGAFQLGIPVSVKTAMLNHHLRLLSVMRWRADRLRPNDRWYLPFRRYVAMIADKVAALGGNPWSVPATPDGAIPLPSGGATGGGDDPGGNGGPGGGGSAGSWPGWWWLLLLIAFLLGALLMWLLLRG